MGGLSGRGDPVSVGRDCTDAFLLQRRKIGAGRSWADANRRWVWGSWFRFALRVVRAVVVCRGRRSGSFQEDEAYDAHASTRDSTSTSRSVHCIRIICVVRMRHRSVLGRSEGIAVEHRADVGTPSRWRRKHHADFRDTFFHRPSAATDTDESKSSADRVRAVRFRSHDGSAVQSRFRGSAGSSAAPRDLRRQVLWSIKCDHSGRSAGVRENPADPDLHCSSFAPDGVRLGRAGRTPDPMRLLLGLGSPA